jgi:hypothetical protein
VIAALALVAAGALYIRLRWRRAPQDLPGDDCGGGVLLWGRFARGRMGSASRWARADHYATKVRIKVRRWRQSSLQLIRYPRCTSRSPWRSLPVAAGFPASPVHRRSVE